MFSFKEAIKEKGGALVMGILNITPDSFSDGGESFSPENVLIKVDELVKDGADIIDIGACSTAPGKTKASLQEEMSRLNQFLPLIVGNANVPISIDTFRSEAAELALRIGASIVNDESGKFNTSMAQVVKDFGAGWIFMHTSGLNSDSVSDHNGNVVKSVLSFFGEMKKSAIDFGIDESRLCYDCGIGFGKSREDDMALLADCESLSQYSPLLIGVSRKRVIGHITGIENPKERDFASAVAASIAVSDGAQIVRVHNVKVTNQALAVYGAMGGGLI